MGEVSCHKRHACPWHTVCDLTPVPHAHATPCAGVMPHAARGVSEGTLLLLPVDGMPDPLGGLAARYALTVVGCIMTDAHVASAASFVCTSRDVGRGFLRC